jgi:hypothetical protein
MKKIIQAIIFLFAILALISPAQSDVTGNWFVVGKLTISAKAPGYKSTKYKDLAYDIFEFHLDKTLLIEIAGINGTWSQINNKWMITWVNTSDVETFFENYMWTYHGSNVSVIFGSFTSSGKERKGETIKGKVVIKGSFIDHDYGALGTATATYSFAGVPVSAAVQDLQSTNTKDLKTAIAESLAEVIQDLRK